MKPKHRSPGASTRALALGVALCLSSASALAALNPKASRLYEDALQRFDKKDYAGTIIQLKNALQIDRKMLAVQVLLGRALLANGEYVAAQAAFEEALALGVNAAEVVLPLAESIEGQGKPGVVLSDPRFAHAALPQDVKARLLRLKAAAATDVGQPRDALAFLDEARALDGGSAESWLAEVPIRVRAGQLTEARAAAEKAVALDPKSAAAAYQRATVAHVGGELRGAVDLYTRALQLQPDSADALVARAGLYIDLGRPAEAAADVQAARKASPTDPRSAYLAALLAERAGNPAEARANLAEVGNLLDPLPIDFIRYRPQLLMLGGLAHFGLGQLEKAKPYLELAQRNDPAGPLAKLLAQVYLKDKRVDAAIELLESYRRAHPNDRQATMLLASSQMSMGRQERAAQLMREALSKGDDPTMRSMLGMSLIGAGRLADGAAELEATLRRDPGQIPAGVTLTQLYMASGQSAKAVALAQSLVKRQGDNPGLQNLLGAAYARKGDAAGARKAFGAALQLQSGFVEPLINLARLDIDERQFDAAEKRLTAVLARDDKNMDAALEMARLASGRGRPDESLRWLLRARDVGGANLRPGIQLVEFHLARGRPDLAREAVDGLRNLAPEALVVLLLQARVQLAGADPKAARSTLTRASTLSNYDAAALTQIAALQIQAGDVGGAAHSLDKALDVRPEHLVANAMRADVDLLQGEPARADKRARALVAAEPRLGLGYTALGNVAATRGQPEAAVEAYRKAHQLDQSGDSLLRLFGALDKTSHSAAVELARRWLREHPADVRVWRSLADAQARAGEMAAARGSYEQLLERAPQDADALNNLANVLIAQKDAGALRVAERALALKPESPYILGTAGWAAFHAGQTERALQLLRDARLRDPDNADARYFLAAALARQGRKNEAREELQGALRGRLGVANAKAAQELLPTLR